MVDCGRVETLPSNRPDSEVTCGLDAGTGFAGLSGEDRFVVASAYQSRIAFVGPGQSADAGPARQFVTFVLHEARLPCGGRTAPPAGSRTLSGFLDDASQRFEPGIYPVEAFGEDGSGRAAWLVCVSNGAPSEKRCAGSGVVEIVQVTECSLSGTLDLEMGAPGERPLRGIFTATYCR